MRKYISGLILVLFFGGLAHAAPALNYTATPASGSAPLTTTLRWSTIEIDYCVENGVTVLANGSRVVNGITVSTNYNIACTSGKDYSDISWVAPTQNEDGSPLTNLAGYKIYYAQTPTGVATAIPVVIANPATTTYRINGQTNSVYYYQMTAYNSNGVESRRTVDITNDINKLTLNSTATVTITTIPTPPGSVTLANPILSTTATAVYNLVKRDNGFVLIYVGQVSLNTPCDITQTVNGYYAVPVSAVTSWSGTVKPIVVLAQCSVH